MDLLEAIIHARQVAENPDCGTVCAYQHDSLADFLEELQLYRNIGEIEYLRELVQRENGCELCRSEHLEKVGIDDRVYLCSGNYRPPEHERFKFCPRCGRNLEG